MTVVVSISALVTDCVLYQDVPIPVEYKQGGWVSRYYLQNTVDSSSTLDSYSSLVFEYKRHIVPAASTMVHWWSSYVKKVL